MNSRAANHIYIDFRYADDSTAIYIARFLPHMICIHRLTVEATSQQNTGRTETGERLSPFSRSLFVRSTVTRASATPMGGSSDSWESECEVPNGDDSL